ncbi:hypothetical protein [Flavobacterium tibetense]|uniref:Uncharacterized protein n=1 Tax=Flavobacterium tibetense TaxID=2233533 RepID=A0A365P1L5_9FLAO|nr:hypothetical protein [Flavobacterium tibetense]RBA28272.1 hypothetical protein DPN68_07515 [Flavobacterium tibetense]
MRNYIKVAILILFFGISNTTFAKVETDTLTTWKLTKDSELLIQSNYFNSKIYTIELNITDEYENLNLFVFYDYNSRIIKREVKFITENKIIAEFQDENDSRLAFKLPKKKIDKLVSKYLNEPIAIIYHDHLNKNGILIGFILFK